MDDGSTKHLCLHGLPNLPYLVAWCEFEGCLTEKKASGHILTVSLIKSNSICHSVMHTQVSIMYAEASMQ